MAELYYSAAPKKAANLSINSDLLRITPQISSVPEKHLKRPIGSLSHFRGQIVGAVGQAITGI